MNLSLPDEATEFGLSATRTLAGLGGLDAARRAESDPEERATRVAPALEDLGVSDLDPRADLGAGAAAGELCRAAGRVALPYPVAGVLLRRADGAGAELPFAPVAEERLGTEPAAGGGEGRGPWRVDHGDLFGEWRVGSVDGWAGRAAPAGARLGSKLGPFVTELSGPAGVDAAATRTEFADGNPQAPRQSEDGADPAGGGTAQDVRFHLTLSAWVVLGAVERALELAVDHVSTRVQFGQAISSFQAVQFQLADAAVGVNGLREMCRFTLWRLFSDPVRSLPDALALRLHALDVARAVLRTTQQLHGAAGLCDEYDISILCRHLQPILRLPFGAERSAEELFTSVSDLGFNSLFPQGPWTQHP
ncbi:MAG: acyl-CoA dehydrogenase family protein [Acidimicrobiales bacterium]